MHTNIIAQLKFSLMVIMVPLVIVVLSTPGTAADYELVTVREWMKLSERERAIAVMYSYEAMMAIAINNPKGRVTWNVADNFVNKNPVEISTSIFQRALDMPKVLDLAFVQLMLAVFTKDSIPDLDMQQLRPETDKYLSDGVNFGTLERY
jgi:hypothetical protein